MRTVGLPKTSAFVEKLAEVEAEIGQEGTRMDCCCCSREGSWRALETIRRVANRRDLCSCAGYGRSGGRDGRSGSAACGR